MARSTWSCRHDGRCSGRSSPGGARWRRAAQISHTPIIAMTGWSHENVRITTIWHASSTGDRRRRVQLSRPVRSSPRHARSASTATGSPTASASATPATTGLACGSRRLIVGPIDSAPLISPAAPCPGRQGERTGPHSQCSPSSLDSRGRRAQLNGDGLPRRAFHRSGPFSPAP